MYGGKRNKINKSCMCMRMHECMCAQTHIYIFATIVKIIAQRGITINLFRVDSLLGIFFAFFLKKNLSIFSNERILYINMNVSLTNERGRTFVSSVLCFEILFIKDKQLYFKSLMPK